MKYDIVVIGNNLDRITASIYALKMNKSVLIIEAINIQDEDLNLTANIGYQKKNNLKNSSNFRKQICDLGGVIKNEEIIEIKDGKEKVIITSDNIYKCDAIIIASGAKYKLLGLKNEKKFIGNGIHFCVSCDASFYKEKNVCVIGGGNIAVTNAINLSNICKNVIIIQNLSKLTAEKELISKLKEKENVKICYNSNVKRIVGDNELKAIVIENDEEKIIEVDGMFISIGLEFESNIIKKLIKVNNCSFNKNNNNICNNIEGVFVTDNIKSKNLEQVVNTINDGIEIAKKTIEYIDCLKH